MGQYHITVNLDKKEIIHPHKIGNGMKMLEQVGWEGATANALFLLLCCSNNRGGGDAREHDMLGRWAGDRIAVVGDYSENYDLPGIDAARLYTIAQEQYTDISPQVLDMMNTCLDVNVVSW